ncbi:hypothetical protein ACFWN2_21745 [Lentzea sp. NPDC058436]
MHVHVVGSAGLDTEAGVGLAQLAPFFDAAREAGLYSVPHW